MSQGAGPGSSTVGGGGGRDERHRGRHDGVRIGTRVSQRRLGNGLGVPPRLLIRL